MTLFQLNREKLINQRLLTFQRIFIIIKKHYPFISNEERAVFINNFIAYKNIIKNLGAPDNIFYEYIEQFVSMIKNSHTKITSYPSKKIYIPANYRTIYADKNYWLFKKNSFIGKIISVDSYNQKQILSVLSRRISASTRQSFLYRATSLLLGSLVKKPAMIIVATNNKIRTITVPRILRHNETRINGIESRTIDNNIRYLRIKSWYGNFKPSLDKEITLLNKSVFSALIVDVRGNAGGNSSNAKYFMKHFFRSRVKLCSVKKRKLKSKSILVSKIFFLKPQKPYFNFPVVILIDSGCLSSTELFIAGLKDNKRALTIGEPTGGSSGNPLESTIPYKNSYIKLLVSTWQMYRINGRLVERKGIKPDIMVHRSHLDYKLGKDPVLKRALHELRMKL